MKPSVPPAYFENLYATDADPWRFATSNYERAKYGATLAALPQPRFTAALEIGCSIGVLTQRLAPRCDFLLAIDVAEAALTQARARCAGLPHITFRRRQIPQDWPEGRFDLILFSEVLYYLSPADLDEAAAKTRASLAPNGAALLVHYTGPTDYPLTGDAAAERLIAATGLRVSLRRREAQYRLDLLRP
jgi:predicted TPR repeat methyltransferase